MTPEVQQKSIQLIKLHEKYKQFIYLDSVGKRTIGYGINLDDDGISEATASYAVNEKNNENAVKLFSGLYFFKDLSNERQIALLDMCYNLGYEGLLKFHDMLFALEQHDYVKAHDAMLDSKWARQVGERAIMLANIISTGNI